MARSAWLSIGAAAVAVAAAVYFSSQQQPLFEVPEAWVPPTIAGVACPHLGVLCRSRALSAALGRGDASAARSLLDAGVASARVALVTPKVCGLAHAWPVVGCWR